MPFYLYFKGKRKMSCSYLISYYNGKSDTEAHNEKKYSAEIETLKLRKQQKINDINQLKTELQKEEVALQKLEQAINNTDGNLTNTNNNISNETGSISSAFTNMVICSSVTSANINNIFGTPFSDEEKKQKQVLANLDTKRNTVKNVIDSKKDEIKANEQELANIEEDIVKYTNQMNDAIRLKNQYSRNADDYRRRRNNCTNDSCIECC
jgi:DNA repair exonuclease SbcCD ATPase subunit